MKRGVVHGRSVMKRILLTTGDTDGIGLEIAIKALNKIKLPRGCQVFVFCSTENLSQTRKLKSCAPEIAGTLEQAFGFADQNFREPIFIVGSRDLPPEWVEQSAVACMKGEAQALVTGPLSKPLIRKAGLKDLGHTEILARISGQKNLFMSFWGSKANVVLVTGHIPIEKVPQVYSIKLLSTALSHTRSFLKAANPQLLKKKIALIGINPHAGDDGLIGKEDRLLRSFANQDRQLLGPLPGDSAFIPANLEKVGVFMASYHDQGLIPFKMLHGFDEGVHVTLGLPFLRTSVDHGPAKELFGKDRAKFGSMKEALELAVQHTTGPRRTNA